MRCPRCQFEFSDEYKFCPECGLATKKSRPQQSLPPNFQEMIKQILEQTKNILSGKTPQKTQLPNFKFPPGMSPAGMVIKIVPDKSGMPKFEIKDMDDKNRPQYKEEDLKPKPKVKKPQVSKYIEPKTQIDDVAGGLAIMIELPEIKKEKDIEIKKIGESIEVRAYGKKIGYFKNIPVSNTSRITSKEFQDEKLYLKVEY